MPWHQHRCAPTTPLQSRKIERGDILSLNCFPMPACCYTALERTLFGRRVLGATHLHLWNINVKVHDGTDRSHQVRRALLRHRHRDGHHDLRALPAAPEPHVRLRPQFRKFYATTTSARRASNVREDVPTVLEHPHRGVHGADDHDSRGPARRRRLPRAQHPGGRPSSPPLDITGFHFTGLHTISCLPEGAWPCNQARTRFFADLTDIIAYVSGAAFTDRPERCVS